MDDVKAALNVLRSMMLDAGYSPVEVAVFVELVCGLDQERALLAIRQQMTSMMWRLGDPLD